MAQAGEGKSQAKGVEENPEPLNYKTWVLRVSIHCEACKKKVNKILHKIEGVYRTDIDLKQQMVTVTGNVEAETLISRLEKKTHKRPMLLLPEKATSKAANKEKKQSKPKPKENPHSNSNNNRNGGEAPKEEGRAEKKTESRRPDVAAGPGGESDPGKNGAGDGKGADDRKQAEEEKKQPEEAKQSVSVTVPAGDQSPVPEQPAAAKTGDSEECGVGVGGKKKKSRAQKGISENIKEGKMGKEVSSGDEPMSSDRSPASGLSQDQGSSLGQGPAPVPVNHVPLHQQFDAYTYSNPYAPHHYHGPPTYAVRYHTAYPMSSDGASYYAPQPPPNSYAYVQPDQESERALPYLDPYSVQPSDSFELFSDENPNACSIM